MRYTIEQLNSYRAENGFAPVSGLSQRAINTQCKEWVASETPRRVNMTGGYDDNNAHNDNR